MSDLRDLYQEVILDHNKRPRNFRKPDGANRHADGHNPLCGDKVSLWLAVEADRVRDIGFQGSGCAISIASASMLTECVKGRTVDEARRLFEGFHRLLTTESGGAASAAGLGKLAAFSGVCEFPVRVKCATLPWHTLLAALEQQDRPVTTE